MYTGVDIVSKYLNLAGVNKELAEENAEIRSTATRIDNPLIISVNSVHDTTAKQQYSYINAEVINNTVNFQKNYLTIDKGSSAGIEPDMAVIGPKGIVGIVFSTSEHFSTIMSVMHVDFKICAKFKKNNYFGSLVWQGDVKGNAKLLEIPYHVDIKLGDTVVTSGFSNIYPTGIPIGTVINYRKDKAENFCDIDIKLTTSFKNIQHVYIVKNVMKAEQDSLEKGTVGHVK